MALAIIFDSVGFGEWFILLAVVLIVVGPRRLPSVARTLGQYYSRFRRAADNFKRQLLDMETEFDRGVAEIEKSTAVDDSAEESGTAEEADTAEGADSVEDDGSAEGVDSAKEGEV